MRRVARGATTVTGLAHPSSERPASVGGGYRVESRPDRTRSGQCLDQLPAHGRPIDADAVEVGTARDEVHALIPVLLAGDPHRLVADGGASVGAGRHEP